MMGISSGDEIMNSWTRLLFSPGFQDSILDCRQCDSPQVLHPECFPIHIPPNDPFFPPVNISSGQPFCMPLTRSMPGQLTLGRQMVLENIIIQLTNNIDNLVEVLQKIRQNYIQYIQYSFLALKKKI